MKNKVQLFLGVVLSLLFILNVSFPSKATAVVPDLDRVRLVVESYQVGEGDVLPGNEMEVTLTVKNISENLTAQNTVLSVVNNQGIVYPVEGMSNQVVIGDVAPGASCQVVVPLRISEKVGNNEEITLIFYFGFLDIGSEEVVNEAYISIPLNWECDLELADLSLSDDCYVNGDAVLSGVVENLGAKMATDVQLHVLAEGAEEVVYALGDIEGGITKLYDHTIRMKVAGEQTLTAYLTYMDGEENLLTSETAEYEVRVLESASDLTKSPDAAEGNVNQKALVVNGALVVVALLIMIVFRRRDARRITSGKEVGYGKRG